MKKAQIVTTICLMLFLVFAVGCQPDGARSLENNPPIAPATIPMLESDTATEPDITTTATLLPVPNATPRVETTATSVPISTQISTGKLHIISEPEGALASIANDGQSEQTPITWTMVPGTYTVTLTLPGYEEWTTPITVTIGSSVTLTASLRQHYTVIPIEEAGGVFDVQWSEDGQSLIYALGDVQWPSHVQSLPVYQSWWLYDVTSGDTQPLPPPQTRVSNTVRESLGICPFPLPETLPYPCSSNLQESITSTRIVFESGKLDDREGYSWLANIDGSDVVSLDKFSDSAQDVMWSSDEQWLLIGRYYAASESSNIYYLVSADGAFVEDLEELTNTSHGLVEGPTPQFSPDGQKVAFVGIEAGNNDLTGERLDQEDAYNLYVLDLNTLESQLVSSRFGLFQWARDGSGLYIMDGSANTVGHRMDYILNDEVNYAELYYIDLTQEAYPEQKLAGAIPLSLPYKGVWAYSPEAHAMAGTFGIAGTVFGILPLEESPFP